MKGLGISEETIVNRTKIREVKNFKVFYRSLNHDDNNHSEEKREVVREILQKYREEVKRKK